MREVGKGLVLIDRYGDPQVKFGLRWVSFARRANNKRRLDDDVGLVSTHIVKDSVRGADESKYCVAH